MQNVVDLGKLLEGLCAYKVEYILVGGLAALIQGTPISTMDVDIVHLQTDSNIQKLLDYLSSIDAIYRRPGNQVIRPCFQNLAALGHNLFSTKLGYLDVLAFVEGNKTYYDLLPFSKIIEFRGYSIKVLSLKKLIELKRESLSPKDKLRLSVLEETLSQSE